MYQSSYNAYESYPDTSYYSINNSSTSSSPEQQSLNYYQYNNNYLINSTTNNENNYSNSYNYQSSPVSSYSYQRYNYIQNSNYNSINSNYNSTCNYITPETNMNYSSINYSSNSSPCHNLEGKNSKENIKLSRKHQLPDEAVEIMNEWFEEHINNPYPTLEEKEKLAKLGRISVKQVSAWFSNRRNRSQNTKPKRIKRVLEKEMNELFQELVYNSNKTPVIEKFRQALVSNSLNL